MSTTKHDKKRRRQDSSDDDDDDDDCVFLSSTGVHRGEEGRKKEDRTYPKRVLKEIETVHGSIQKKRAKKAAKSSSSSPHEVFIVIHEELCVYNDTEFKVIGTYARVEMANEQVLKVFKESHGEFLNEELSDGDSDDDNNDDNESDDDDYGDSHFVKIDPGDESNVDINQVAWSINEHGALSLRVMEGGDGDRYTVCTLRQKVQV